MLRTMQAASEVAQLGGHPLPPPCAWWLATRGAAEALDLGDRIGSIEPGRDADLVVIDLRSTSLIDFRMLDQVGRHALFDLAVSAKGDLHIDAHHTVEDIGITLGQAFKRAMGDKKGIRRYGHAERASRL